MFCDKVTIQLIAGKGGDGALSFLHEKYREKGGPDGGNGGHGGSIFIVTDSSINTLYDYKTKTRIKAESGENGKMRKKAGAGADDLYVKVPIGTVVIDAETGEKIFDLVGGKQAVMVARGGEGGQGGAETFGCDNCTGSAPNRLTRRRGHDPAFALPDPRAGARHQSGSGSVPDCALCRWRPRDQ